MKKFVFQAVLLLIVTAAALLLFQTGSGVPSLPFIPEQAVTGTVVVNNAQIKVEIADTQKKRSKGLSGKTSLGQDEGMLFIFPQTGKYPFWMKGLTFPLDFIWIRGDKVVDVLENVPPPQSGQSESSLPIYQSNQDVDKVLEVSAGTVKRLNIKAGDTIKII